MTFLAERPCHLLIESSAGHVHAYWKLDRPLPATMVIESTGELAEPIERAHLRLIHISAPTRRASRTSRTRRAPSGRGSCASPAA